MQGGGQLHDAEARAEVAAGLRHRVDGLQAQFVGDLTQLCRLHSAQIGWRLHAVQKRRFQVTHSQSFDRRFSERRLK